MKVVLRFALSYIYSIFMVYLSYIYSIFMVCCGLLEVWVEIVDIPDILERCACPVGGRFVEDWD